MLRVSRRVFLAGSTLAALNLPRVASAAAPPWLAGVKVAPTCYIPDNPGARDYRQQYNLSCEVASFKIVLFHYGMANVSEELLQDVLGVNENPNKGFRGDYRALSTHGLQNYGAHAPALKPMIEQFPKPGMFTAWPLANLDQARVALNRNWLVMAWIPVALEPSAREAVTLSTGERVSLVPGEHAIVLHGYNQSGFFTYDPRPSPRVASWVATSDLARGMALFDVPGLAIQPLF